MFRSSKYVRRASSRIPLPSASATVGGLKVIGARDAYKMKLQAWLWRARPEPVEQCSAEP